MSHIFKTISKAWVPVRDAVETAGVLAGNYYLPGSAILTKNLASKGSQKQLGSTLGQIAQIGTGLTGGGVGSGMTGIPAASSVGGGWTNALNGVGNVFGNGTLGTDITNGLSNMFSSAPAASGSGSPLTSLNSSFDPATANSSGSGNVFQDAFKAGGDPTSLTGAGGMASGATGATDTAPSSLSSLLGSSPLSTLAKLASVAQLVAGGGENYKGAVTQQQTQDQIAAQRAAQQQLNTGFINSLNAGANTPLRSQTNPGNANGTNYYTYGQRPAESFFTNPAPIDFPNVQTTPLQSLKAGGKVNPNAGGKGGQDDNVRANLSTDEHVIPADAVSDLGDGSSAGGHKALEQMVKNVRKHKSSKGTGLPPMAKSPLQYMGAGA